MLNHTLLQRRLRAVDRARRARRGRRRRRRLTSLEYVADIRPDFLKLRAAWSPASTANRPPAVLRATAAFAAEVGARVVAEGVERPEELEALRAMDIELGEAAVVRRRGAVAAGPVAGAPLRGAACKCWPLERGLDVLERREACEAVVDHSRAAVCFERLPRPCCAARPRGAGRSTTACATPDRRPRFCRRERDRRRRGDVLDHLPCAVGAPRCVPAWRVAGGRGVVPTPIGPPADAARRTRSSAAPRCCGAAGGRRAPRRPSGWRARPPSSRRRRPRGRRARGAGGVAGAVGLRVGR